VDLLGRLRSWHDDIRARLQDEGYVVEFVPPVAGRLTSSESVLVGSPRRLGKLTVWSTGDAELELGNVETGEFTAQHRAITGTASIADAADALVAWVRET
jgi:hypothetical protein